MIDTEERRTLQEIDDAKRIRKVVESFQANSDAIDAERAAIEELKKRLDDPEAKAISERYYALESEMDVMERSVDLFGNPSVLFENQRRLQQQINTLLSNRYELISRHCEDDTSYYAMLNEDGSQRAQRWSAEREAEVCKKWKARALLSQLTLPVQVETLIETFSDVQTRGKLAPLVETDKEEEGCFVGIKDSVGFENLKGPKAHSTTITGEMSSSSSADLPPNTRSTFPQATTRTLQPIIGDYNNDNSDMSAPGQLSARHLRVSFVTHAN